MDITNEILSTVAPEALRRCGFCGEKRPVWQISCIAGRPSCEDCTHVARLAPCEHCGLAASEGCACWCGACGREPTDGTFCDTCIANMRADQ